MKIIKAYSACEPEKLLHAFGFKGSSLTELWQVYVAVKGESGEVGVGVGVQSVLWSDSKVFSTFGELKSNQLMYEVTLKAVELINGLEFSSPEQVTHKIFDDLYDYACEIVGFKVTETFVLNALVAVDFAVWSLWAKEKGTTNFDDIFKGETKSEVLSNIPLITYGTSIDSVKDLAKSGVCLFKIKLGCDPEGDGDLDKMLAWDKERALQIHNALKDVYTPYTDCGRPLYYFDANGRYDTYERLEELIEFFKQNGILERVCTFEEPFAPENEVDVTNLPVNFAADESAHSLKDVKKRISLGYKTITLKPIAKTLSVSIDMANCAREKGVQCFCADLTVNPYMVEWNKNFASRLAPLKGMNVGVVESNGKQNYVNWEKMKNYPSIPFQDSQVYKLDELFYETSQGVFNAPDYYVDYILKSNNIKTF